MHRSQHPTTIGAAPCRARTLAGGLPQHSRPAQAGHHHKSSWSAPPRPLPHPPQAKPWRPLADDVERLSTGGAAKRRGTGSFHVPHRLAQDERPPFAAAKKSGFLAIRGSGGRRGSKRGGGKGSGRPLLNAWRQWCDAKGWACVVVEQATGLVAATATVEAEEDESDSGGDQSAAAAAPSAVVIVDFSTLRVLDARPAASKARVVALAAAAEAADAIRELGVFERGDSEVPFDVMAAAADGGPEEEQSGGAGAGEDLFGGEEHEGGALAEAAAAAAAAAAVPGRVRLRGGEPASDNDQQSNDARLDPSLPDGHPYATSAIWSIPAQPLFFAVEGDASNAKGLAAALAKALNGGAGGGGASGATGKKKSGAARLRRVFDD